MQMEIVIPQSAMPKKDPEHPCPCQSRPFQLKEKTGEITWLVNIGERVEKNQVICEGEVEKKTLEFTAPCDGVLLEKCIEDEEDFEAGDVIGYVESDIELFLISGFLGSGKTTFIQNILNISDKRIGIIVNEFGSVSIDGKVLNKDDVKMVEINNGSIFCACLKSGFVKTLAAFLSQPIDRLYIESSGMADPSSMENLLEQLSPLLEKKYKTNRRYAYKGAICIVDAGKFIDLSECVPVISSQVKKSGLILLNKRDMVSEKGLEKVYDSLKKINPEAHIYETEYARVEEELLQKYMKGELKKVNDTLNVAVNRPYGGILIIQNQDGIENVNEFLNKISSKMIRMKGFFVAADKYYHVDCVADDIKIEEVHEMDKDMNKLVLISSKEESCLEWLKENWRKCFKDEFMFEEE